MDGGNRCNLASTSKNKREQFLQTQLIIECASPIHLPIWFNKFYLVGVHGEYPEAVVYVEGGFFENVEPPH